MNSYLWICYVFYLGEYRPSKHLTVQVTSSWLDKIVLLRFNVTFRNIHLSKYSDIRSVSVICSNNGYMVYIGN